MKSTEAFGVLWKFLSEFCSAFPSNVHNKQTLRTFRPVCEILYLLVCHMMCVRLGISTEKHMSNKLKR